MARGLKFRFKKERGTVYMQNRFSLDAAQMVNRMVMESCELLGNLFWSCRDSIKPSLLFFLLASRESTKLSEFCVIFGVGVSCRFLYSIVS